MYVVGFEALFHRSKYLINVHQKGQVLEYFWIFNSEGDSYYTLYLILLHERLKYGKNTYLRLITEKRVK